jgi:probable phosphoglycerate mutase
VTTTLYLIRHGTHALLGKVLTGRMPHVHLDSHGQQEAQRLAQRFAHEAVNAVVSSPIDRARETAAPIAERLGTEVELSEGFNEVDVGTWTGRTFSDLQADPGWLQWNTRRSLARPPNGESMLDVQCRAVREVERIQAKHSGGCALVVSHGDVIRAALLYYLGMPLDHFDRIEVAPGTVSTLVIGDWGAKIPSFGEAPPP